MRLRMVPVGGLKPPEPNPRTPRGSLQCIPVAAVSGRSAPVRTRQTMRPLNDAVSRQPAGTGRLASSWSMAFDNRFAKLCLDKTLFFPIVSGGGIYQ